ncbi:MAG: lytic transglycosylase domain-containing protein, partial [Chloroflexi bacterium]|nr:lytic transglycosylase domain-containing protein [Chloroflexota bacterium]
FRKHYPTDRRARQALFREGLALYAQGRPAEAVPLWTEWLAAADLSAADTAKGLTWLGLAAQAMGDPSTAQSLWQKAEEAAPTLYYGLRARDLRLGLSPTLTEREDVSVPPMTFDEGSWQEIETWVKAWFTPTLTVTDTVRLDALTARAEALGRLGWYEDRKATLQQARERAWETPPALLRLARWNAEHGTYAYAIQAAERLLALGKSQGAVEAPEALWRIAYPTVYGHLVEREASRYGLDPLLFLALIRQESRFDARAVSYAGATGLAQVMPQTASWIAERLGEANYRRDLLTRPMVSLRYGAWYFHTMLTMFNRDWEVSLVAYNAGPGNAKRWTKGQPITDHDLFFETIPLQEPQNYVRLIYEQYAIYRRLYGEKTGSPSTSENP